MLYTKIFALTFALATGALAAPSADASISKPSKPSKPSAPVIINQANQQKNSCGNDVTSYCCNSDSGKYTNCKTLGKLAIILPLLS